MIKIIITGNPVPWKAHAGFGRKSFNPRYKEKEAYQWQLQRHWQVKRDGDRELPYGGAVELHMVYYLPIPSKTSKKRRAAMLAGELSHTKRPDLDNLNKFLCDCLKGIVIVDDSQVISLTAEKEYGETPHTICYVHFLD